MCNHEEHQPKQMFLLTSRLRHNWRRDAAQTRVTVRECSKVSESVEQYCSRGADHAMETSVMGLRAGRGGYALRLRITHTLPIHFSLLAIPLFHPPPQFSPVVLMMGGSIVQCMAALRDSYCVSGSILL